MTRSATPGEPETEAGRILLGWRGQHAHWTEKMWTDAILAIEAEARAESSAEMVPNAWTTQELLDIYDRTADRPTIRAKIQKWVRDDR